MTGRLLIAVAGTLLPIGALLQYFYTRDLHREPRFVLAWTFILGVLAIGPVLLVALPLSLALPRSAGPLAAALYEAFALAAIPEEFFKLLVVKRYSARRPSFNEPMDGLVYGATAALGFAALENALYVAAGGWVTALARSLTAVPMHAAAGAILGHSVARAKFSPAGRSAVARGLLAAVAVHGLYDFGLLGASGLAASPEAGSVRTGLTIASLFLLALAVLVGSLRWTVRTTRRLRADQLAEPPASSEAP